MPSQHQPPSKRQKHAASDVRTSVAKQQFHGGNKGIRNRGKEISVENRELQSGPIWDPTSALALASASVRVPAKCRCSSNASSPEVELMRGKKAKWLRSRFHRRCKQAGGKVPILALERWLCRWQLAVSMSLDPLLPSLRDILCATAGVGTRAATGGLVSDLTRVRIPAPAALVIAEELLADSTSAVDALAAMLVGSGGPPVFATQRWTGGAICLSIGTPCAKPYFIVSDAHMQKLATLYARYSALVTTSVGPASAADQPPFGSARVSKKRLTTGAVVAKGWKSRASRLADPSRSNPDFLRSVFCLLARYDSLGGHGYQAAVGQHGFTWLRDHMDVHFECFASPLNCRFGRYCSAFPDTDTPFGSVGSFFDFAPTTGSFEANPPFVPELMNKAVAHIETLLQGSDEPMSFCFVIPAWQSIPAYKSKKDRLLSLVGLGRQPPCIGGTESATEFSYPGVSLCSNHYL